MHSLPAHARSFRRWKTAPNRPRSTPLEHRSIRRRPRSYLSQLQLDKTQVRAPIDGIVASVSTALGAMVAPGNPVAVLMSPDVEIVVAVEETRLADLAVGKPATIRVDAYPDREFAGEVVQIAPTLDPATRTVKVTIRPLDGDGALLPGMFAIG